MTENVVEIGGSSASRRMMTAMVARLDNSDAGITSKPTPIEPSPVGAGIEEKWGRNSNRRANPGITEEKYHDNE
jgi:hypothetical protein